MTTLVLNLILPSVVAKETLMKQDFCLMRGFGLLALDERTPLGLLSRTVGSRERGGEAMELEEDRKQTKESQDLWV